MSVCCTNCSMGDRHAATLLILQPQLTALVNRGRADPCMLHINTECGLTTHQWILRTLMLVHAGQISTLCCGVLTKPCLGKMNLSSSCTSADKATSSSQACLVSAACFVHFACGFLQAETIEAAAHGTPQHLLTHNLNMHGNFRQAISWPVQPIDDVHTGEGVTHADGSYQLKDTAQQYKSDGQFPHLAGCKMLAVPALPYNEVGHFKVLLGLCHAPCWLLRCAVKLHNMIMLIAAANVG